MSVKTDKDTESEQVNNQPSPIKFTNPSKNLESVINERIIFIKNVVNVTQNTIVIHIKKCPFYIIS